MDINKAYDNAMEAIDNSNMSEEEKQDERIAVGEEIREQEYARQAEHDDIDRR